jgi:uncharacterized C2H2 Zn-finger protein
MQGHSFNRKLHCTGMYLYCGRCGLIKLGNKESTKAANKACGGLRELDDEEYLKLKGRK